MSSMRQTSPVRLGFETSSLRISVADILPLRQLAPAVVKSVKYAQIAASIAEVGIIEPPVVVRDKADSNLFHLLDGHVRIHILRSRGESEVVCLVANEDEAFTYNKRISRIATIQEYKMILKAIEKGVPEERLARALNVNIGSIRQKRSLLNGICPEVAELLKDKHIPINTLGELKKLKPIRQIEAAELMIAMNTYSISYAKSLVAATPEGQLVKGTKTIQGLNLQQIEMMESESATLDREFKAIEQDYGSDHLDVVLATGYVARLLENARIVRHLAQRYPDILAEFQKIAEIQKAA
ncbi:MAG: plasmid partitioning protein RepB C-terminal domain-containing protein [Hyphomicrobium sp.]